VGPVGARRFGPWKSDALVRDTKKRSWQCQRDSASAETQKRSDRECHRARHPARGRPTKPKRVDVRKPSGDRAALRGEVTMVEVGDAASTVLPLEAGDAGNGQPASAPKALGSSERASVSKGPDWRRGSKRRKPGARERDDPTGSRDNKSVAEAGKRHLLQARRRRASVMVGQGVAARGGPSP
jgi:hypothetical protein